MMQGISFYQLELTNQIYNLNYRLNIFNNIFILFYFNYIIKNKYLSMS
jgi:hypothetical protein